MLTISQLLRYTFPVAKRNSALVSLSHIRRGVNKAKQAKIIAKAQTHDQRGRAAQVYTCSCTALDAKKLFTGPVKVSCSCLTGETLVHTVDGYKSIYSLAEKKSKKATVDYVVDGKVYTGTAPFYTGKKPVWTLEFNNGNSVTGTRDHLFECYTDNGREWVQVGDIVPGMKILRSVDAVNVNFDKSAFDHGFFLGTLMGDGTVSHGKYPDIQLYGEKAALVDEYAKLGLVKNTAPTARRDGVRVTFTHRALELMIRYRFVNKSSVDLPSKSHILGYISGLLYTDGSITRQVKIDGAIEYIHQLQHYLMDLGLSSPVLAKVGVSGRKTNYGIANKNLWRLSLPVSALIELAPYLRLREKHASSLEFILDRTKQDRLPVVTVTGKKYAGRQLVYDISVPEISCFSANGVIAHNCDYFMYTCEYALNRQGAADILYSNGEPPNDKNPTLVPSVCKHLYTLLSDIKSGQV